MAEEQNGKLAAESEPEDQSPRRRLPLVLGVAGALGACLCLCLVAAVGLYLSEEDGGGGSQVAVVPEPAIETVSLPAAGGAEPFMAEVVDGIARTARGETPLPASASGDPAAQARAYLDLYPDLYPIAAAAELQTEQVFDLEGGGRGVRLGFAVNGIPVDGASIIVHIKPGDVVTWAAASYPRSLDVETRPEIGEAEAAAAAAAALDELGGGATPTVLDAQLIVFNPGLFSDTISDSALAWKVMVAGDLLAATVIVDAQTGEVLASWDDADPLAPGDPPWSIYTINNVPYKDKSKEQIEALRVLLMSETGAAAGAAPDDVARRVADYVGQVLAYFRDTFGRDGHDGAGARLHVHVHAGPPDYDNASWSEMRGGMFIGDRRLDLDVVAHEFAHGVIARTLGLVGTDSQAGALNESMADVFAAFITGNWQMGEGTDAGTLRDVTQPRDMGHYLNGEDTKHRNSRIPSHAAFLIADDSPASAGLRKVTSPDGEEITWSGLGIPKTQQIYYRVLGNQSLGSTPSFSSMREALTKACLDLVMEGRHGLVQHDCGVILNAFAAIGVGSVDSDFDTIPDLRSDGTPHDNCRTRANRDQNDEDRNRVGDACETWVIVELETRWREVEDLCRIDNPPSDVWLFDRVIYYFGTREEVEIYTGTDEFQVGSWLNKAGRQWENFEIARAGLTEYPDRAAAEAQLQAIRAANPGGSDDPDDADEAWTVRRAWGEPVPLAESERRAACGDDSLGEDEAQDEAPAVWVLVETRINEGQFPLQDTSKADFNSAYEGSIDAWSVSETNMSAAKRTVYAGEALTDATSTFTFDAPPDELVPGEALRLEASGSMAVSAAQQTPFEQFQYEVNGNQVPASYFQIDPDNPSESVSVEIVIPSGQSGDTWTLSAGLWNCSGCDVNWIYEMP